MTDGSGWPGTTRFQASDRVAQSHRQRGRHGRRQRRLPS